MWCVRGLCMSFPDSHPHYCVGGVLLSKGNQLCVCMFLWVWIIKISLVFFFLWFVHWWAIVWPKFKHGKFIKICSSGGDVCGDYIRGSGHGRLSGCVVLYSFAGKTTVTFEIPFSMTYARTCTQIKRTHTQVHLQKNLRALGTWTFKEFVLIFKTMN